MASSLYSKFLKNFQKFTEDYNKEIIEKMSELKFDEETQKKFEEVLTSMVYKPDSSSSKNVVKKKREPTAYNLFMKDMIKKLREEHPDIDKTDLMKRGAQEWQKQKKIKADAAAAAEAPKSKGKK
jgi:hypothetical protein